MPDDLVISVRQISQYPFRAAAAATDAILLQTGGLGGPYAYTDPMGLLAPLAAGGPLGIGTSPPYDAFNAQTFTGWSVLEAEGSLVFNAYADKGGVSRYLTSGHPAGILSMDAAQGFSFGWAVPDVADSPVTWNTLFTIHPDGAQWATKSLTLDGDLTVGGHASVAGDPVATVPWVKDFVVDFAFTRNVRSWNGERGDVRFTILDLIAMGGAPLCNPRFEGRATLNGDPLATENYALAAIDGIFTLDHMICLGLAPLHSPPFAGRPTAPTPPIANSSDRLATTRFVHQFAARRIDNAVDDAIAAATDGLDATIRQGVADALAGLDVATEDWVQGQITGQLAGYLPLTGGTLTGPVVSTYSNPFTPGLDLAGMLRVASTRGSMNMVTVTSTATSPNNESGLNINIAGTSGSGRAIVAVSPTGSTVQSQSGPALAAIRAVSAPIAEANNTVNCLLAQTNYTGTQVTDNIVGDVAFGTSVYRPAAIQAAATQTWTGGTAMGTRLDFRTTPNGSGARQLAMTIGQDMLLTVRNGITSTNGNVDLTRNGGYFDLNLRSDWFPRLNFYSPSGGYINSYVSGTQTWALAMGTTFELSRYAAGVYVDKPLAIGSNGIVSLMGQVLSFGPADSAGAGYRTVRVPN